MTTRSSAAGTASCAKRKKNTRRQSAVEDLRYARHRRGTKATKPHQKKRKREKWKPDEEPA